MNKFQVEMQHSEESLVALSHMQYDLFCKRNRLARNILSLALCALGVMFYSRWWGILAMAYGCYLFTSTYAAANRTARNLAAQIRASGMSFPHSRYIFGENSIRVISLPTEEELDPLPYSQVFGLGEDSGSYYIFRDQYGGYVVPKSSLGGDAQAFKAYVEGRTGKYFCRPRQAPIQRLRQRLRKRENEPFHL